jgi:hypothetical protein
LRGTFFFFDRDNLSPFDDVTTEANVQEGVPPITEQGPVMKHRTLHFFDTEGLLEDDRWVGFIHSDMTANCGAQRKRPFTFIASVLIFRKCSTAGVDFDNAKLNLMAFAASHNLDSRIHQEEFELDKWEDTFLVIRCLIMLFVFPFTILSHHSWRGEK